MDALSIANLKKRKEEYHVFVIRIVQKVLSHLKSMSSEDIGIGDIGNYMVSLHESKNSNQVVFLIQQRDLFLKNREREDNNLLMLQEKIKEANATGNPSVLMKVANHKNAIERIEYFNDKTVASLFHHFSDNCEDLVNSFFEKYNNLDDVNLTLDKYNQLMRLFSLRLEVRPEQVFQVNKIVNAFEILKALEGEDLSSLTLLNAPLKFKGVRNKFVHKNGQTITEEEANINKVLLSFMANPTYESISIEDVNVLMLSLEAFPDKFDVPVLEKVLLKMYKDNNNHIPSILSALASFSEIYGEKIKDPKILEELDKLQVAPFKIYEKVGNFVSLKLINNYWIPRADIYSRNNAKVVKIKIENGEIVSFYQFLFMILQSLQYLNGKVVVKSVGVKNELDADCVVLSTNNEGVDFLVSLGDGITVENLEENLKVCLNAVGSWSRKNPVSKITGKFFKSGDLLKHEALSYYAASVSKYDLDLIVQEAQEESAFDNLSLDDVKL